MSVKMKIIISVIYVCAVFTNVGCSWLNHIDFEKLLHSNADSLVDLAEKENELKLVKYIKATGLETKLTEQGPFTLFGPTDEAFGLLPDPVIHYLKRNLTALTDVLKYHVINGKVFSSQLSDNLLVDTLFPGKQIRINIYKNGVITASGRPVLRPNLNASNGVLHEIGGVMLPPEGDIVDTVTQKVMKQTFGTLVEAVQAAGLVDALKGKGPLTVFAPTNRAFSKIDLPALLKNKTQLQNVLKYHVVTGAAYSPGLENGKLLTTLNGKTVNITIMEGEVMVNKARVEYPDLTTTNGVIHVIDAVLMPPEVKHHPSFEVVSRGSKFFSLRDNILHL